MLVCERNYFTSSEVSKRNLISSTRSIGDIDKLPFSYDLIVSHIRADGVGYGGDKALVYAYTEEARDRARTVALIYRTDEVTEGMVRIVLMHRQRY